MAYNVKMSFFSTRTEHELFQALERNIGEAAIITRTVRAARVLRQRYNHWQQASGNSGWLTPQILAWEPWLRTLWNGACIGGAETRVLLTDVQELHLWRQVLTKDETARQTLSLSGLAERSQNAHKELNRYNIPLQRLSMDTSKDAQAFYAWSIEFEKLCRKSGYLPSAQIEAAISQALPGNQFHVPKELFLVGFDRTTPSQISLIDALHARGCSVQAVDLGSPGAASADHAIVYASTLEEEIACAAHWIRRELTANPAQRIGVIVPGLAEMRDWIDAIFRRILAPSSMVLPAPRVLLPYEFSLGAAMHLLQPVRTALTLLQWIVEAIPPEEISWLLVHGCFSSGPQDARAILDRRFRERDFQLGGPISFNTFRKWMSQSNSRQGSASMGRTVDRLFAAMQGNGLSRLRSFAEWREVIEELLTTADWHLLAATESADYQLLRRWNVLLNDVSALNAVAGPVGFSTVVETLRRMASHTLFALETRNAPVQVLGTSESAGILFDSVWWLNAHASVWPQRGKAQPFISWNLQREALMPYADPVEDHAFAQRVTKRILASGKTIVCSYALQESDPDAASSHIPEREILLSPLIREMLPIIPAISVEEFLPHDVRAQTSHATSQFEPLFQEPAVPLHADKVRGGVDFLKFQAACPFRAFAELRLGTRPLAVPDSGLSPAAQGTLLHKVLQKFWTEVQSQKKLLETTTEEHRQILRGNIRTAMAAFFENAIEPWQQALLSIEADRIEDRLIAWMEVEKQRPDFTVMQTERSLDHARLAGIELQCRIDRIDAVEQGIVLLDYKTGAVSRKDCEGDRPDQPQLPAYAVLRDQSSTTGKPLAGVAFAGLAARKVDLTVVASLSSTLTASLEQGSGEPATIKSSRKTKRNPAALSPEEMQDLLDAWSTTLTRLAESFRSGVAVVDPKKPVETCKHCSQALLCRIRETEELLAEDLEEGQESIHAAEAFES